LKQFRFRLEKILKYKNQVEDRKKQFLSERNHLLNMEINHLNRLSDRCVSYQDRYFSLFKGKMNIFRLLATRRYLDKLTDEISRQKNKVRESQKRVDRAKIDLQAAMRDRKKYDKLKEKRKKEYDYEAGRDERKEFDEIGSRPKTRTPMDIAPV